MSRDIVSYIIFTTTDDFEVWQHASTTRIKIINIAPIVLSMGGDVEATTMNADVRVGVFVTYFSEEQSYE